MLFSVPGMKKRFTKLNPVGYIGLYWVCRLISTFVKPLRMLLKWPWMSRCGDYWQQAELRTDGACRITMMMMICKRLEVSGSGISMGFQLLE